MSVNIANDFNISEQFFRDAIADEIKKTDFHSVVPLCSRVRKEPRYHMPPEVTVDNITALLRPVSKEMTFTDSRKTQWAAITHVLIDSIDSDNEVSTEADKIILATVLMRIQVTFLDMLHRYPEFALLIKAKFEQLIIGSKCYELTSIYNEIFTDHMYDPYTDGKSDAVNELVLTADDVYVLTKRYNDEIATRIKRQNSLRPVPKFEEQEIVGAKDKEGKWWMSRVLRIFTHAEHNVYYVEFLGWGDKFNEFITDAWRIARFNPRIHIYYRPAWKKAKESKDDKDKESDDDAVSSVNEMDSQKKM